mmetsp:Transcript_40956/g.66424  ORF Transcript_40956/g.66424 Transcript_40956/m.66424 type:complete len:135 (+) Transcript_40956:94-498(+)
MMANLSFGVFWPLLLFTLVLSTFAEQTAQKPPSAQKESKIECNVTALCSSCSSLKEGKKEAACGETGWREGIVCVGSNNKYRPCNPPKIFSAPNNPQDVLTLEAILLLVAGSTWYAIRLRKRQTYANQHQRVSS